MKNNVILFSLFILLNLNALDIVNLNFFIEPEYNLENQLKIASQVFASTYQDSIDFYNFFCGKILRTQHSDETLVNFLNAIDCDYAVPIDYQFSPADESHHFSIISSHIATSNPNIIPYEIIETDSMKIGIIAIYSPDTFVSRDLHDEAIYEYNFLEKMKAISNHLEEECDYIVLLSNFSKNIDTDLVNGLAIDSIISFDYQSKKNERYGKPKWFSSKANKGLLGTLTLSYSQGKINSNWKATKINE